VASQAGDETALIRSSSRVSRNSPSGTELTAMEHHETKSSPQASFAALSRAKTVRELLTVNIGFFDGPMGGVYPSQYPQAELSSQGDRTITAAPLDERTNPLSHGLADKYQRMTTGRDSSELVYRGRAKAQSIIICTITPQCQPNSDRRTPAQPRQTL
jgi:hypothetical protein